MTNISGAAAPRKQNAMPHTALSFSEHLHHAIEQLDSLQLPPDDETSDRCAPIDRQTQTQTQTRPRTRTRTRTRASTNSQSLTKCETKLDKKVVSISRNSSDSDIDSDDDDRDRHCDRDSDRCSDGASDGDDDSDGDSDSDDNDLIPRGPANSRSISLNRSQPYQRHLPHLQPQPQPQPQQQTQHLQANESEGVQLLIQEVLNNPVFKEVLNSCLDQLQLTQTQTETETETETQTETETSDGSRGSRKDVAVAIGPGAGNDLSDNLSLLGCVQSGTFQAAQLVTEESSFRDPYLLGGTAIPSASKSQRTGYSPVRSPRENDYRGSHDCAFPQINLSSYSSLNSTGNCQVSATATYRAAPNYFSSPSCSPSSSNQSYADASSPNSLHQIPVDQRQASEPVDPHPRNHLSFDIGQLLNDASEESPYPGSVTQPYPIQFTASPPSPRANVAAVASWVSDNVATRRLSESARNHLDSSAIAREPDRNVILRPYVSLPSVRANEKLIQRLSPAEVEKAMRSLLKRSDQELAMQDEDGDTPLMRLVGNPDELERKMAYLVPLVERLSTVTGTLTATNSRGEDALYLAALNSNKFPFVAAYLATIMLDNGIDVSQRLYHARGETLLHLVAAQGDSHEQMLAELLALKIFDPQRSTYDGRTALHVAVESREPLATVKLLLDHGADPSAKEKERDNTALHLAICSRYGCEPRLVKLLLNGRARDLVNATNCNRDTPLHVAAAMSDLPFERQKEICLELTYAGSDTNLRNLAEKTPLDLVPSTRKKAIQRIFSGKHVATLESWFNSLQF